MGEIHHQQSATASRLGLRGSATTGGEIVEVQGGHIVRSTGRKDRHSKVCTAKGPRDRRVRLSAHTAIQFYDVQDRLGYDRPSKAVDWLIKKAKTAIDELAELPAWKPTAGPTAITNFEQTPQESHQNQQQIVESENHQQQQQQQQLQNNSSFLPPSMDSDSIADTIKSFFPMGASTAANSSGMQQFQSFPPPDLLSRTSSQNQDLRLSLQSFQDPIFIHNQHQNPNTHQNEQPTIFSSQPHLGFDGSGSWTETQARFSRMVACGGGGGGGYGSVGGGGGFMFHSPPQATPFLFAGQTQLFSQREPLQSSNTPSVRAWIDPPPGFSVAGGIEHHQQQHQQQQLQTLSFHPSSIGFASSGGGFSGFRVPARIQGEEEEHDGTSDQPSSASSDSRH